MSSREFRTPRRARARAVHLLTIVLLAACADEAPTTPDHVAADAEHAEHVELLATPEPDSLGWITAGFEHACALDVAGAAYCWGSNSSGQLGATPARDCDGTPCTTLPIAVGGGRVYSAISGGIEHTCGVEQGTGRVYCWGGNGFGQLGRGPGAGSQLPVRALAGSVQFTAVSAGDYHTCALATNARVWCWGANDSGQTTGDSVVTYRPRRVRGAHDYVDLSAGGAHTCAVAATTAAYCWGSNQFGQTGTADPDTVTSARRVAGPIGYARVAAGVHHTCAVRGTAQRIFCWGANDHRQNGHAGTGGPEPKPIDGNLAYHSVSAGDLHTCGLRPTGRTDCWGSGVFGQLATGDSATSGQPPTLVDGSHTSIEIGHSFTCAAVGDGRLHCWGKNRANQVGRLRTLAGSCWGEYCAPIMGRVQGSVVFR